MYLDGEPARFDDDERLSQAIMKSKIDRAALVAAVSNLQGLTSEQKSALLELINDHKKYGLVWEEKPEDVEERLRDELPILREVKDRAIISDAPDAPNHVLIEGDNLEALTALSYTHEGRIDVIYIDPPYNTGNKDFVYNDQYVDSEDSYRHSKWLSFMNKRLKIAKRLLSDRGVIFISIDDNEQAQLKLLCDSIFGEEKFVATFPWRKRTAKTDVPHSISQDYEWIICISNIQFQAGIEKESRKYYETPDFPNRPWRTHDMSTQRTAIERPNSDFTIINPKNGKEYPVNPMAVWRITKDGFPKYLQENRIIFPGDYKFLKITKPVLRYWKEEDEKKAGETFGYTTVSSDFPKDVGMTQDGTKDITDIFGDKSFGYPKPKALIKYIVKISTPNAKRLTILDFFAGSGTTLHATMQLNAEDGGHRQCILVTNNENGICENVTYERNKRVIRGYTTPKGQQVEGLKENNLRYYKIDSVPREQTAENKRQLMEVSTDLLCIKHNLYDEKNTFFGLNLSQQVARYFEEQGRGMLIIYRPDAIPYIVKALAKANEIAEPIQTYVACDGAYPFTDDFHGVLDRVELHAMPYSLYQAYRQVLPPKSERQDFADQPEVSEQELNEADANLYTSEDHD